MDGSGVPRTVAERLYYDLDAALEFQAVVTGLRSGGREGGSDGQGKPLWHLALDRTAFYPAGGGQPWDQGLLLATLPNAETLRVEVERVEEDAAGQVWHAVWEPVAVGAPVLGRVDAERRMDHAQQHSGQHLLSAMFLRELGLPTVSFHLGAQSVTIDLKAEMICPEDLARVEDAVNRVIFEDRRMLSRWVEREEAEQMLARGELRKLPERAGPIRIVQMEGVESNACGGTHVRSTGAIGGLLVRRVEKVRQGQRVEFCCGLRAVRAARSDLARLRESGALLSVGPAELAGRVAGLMEDRKQRAKERKLLERQIKELEDRLRASSQQRRRGDEGSEQG